MFEIPYTVGELVMYTHGGVDNPEDWVEATVIENALPSAIQVEIHIDDEGEPRSVLTDHVVRNISRFTSSGTPPDDETFV